MSIRVDTSSLIPGAIVCGNRGLGVLGSAIPSEPTDTSPVPSFLQIDSPLAVALPAVVHPEVLFRVLEDDVFHLTVYGFREPNEFFFFVIVGSRVDGIGHKPDITVTVPFAAACHHHDGALVDDGEESGNNEARPERKAL